MAEGIYASMRKQPKNRAYTALADRRGLITELACITQQ